MKNTTLCYIEQNGQYLMLHRIKKENDCNRDKWIGIGGHFEEYESPLDCILREAREETGLTLTDCAYRGIVSFCSPGYETEQMHLFFCRAFEGELNRDCEEGELSWISRDMLYALPMWEGDRIFLDLLHKNVPFFSLKLVYDAEGRLLSH
ncbi:MAG: NUDIX hydrolase, partial [Eubacteriales bacterium]